MPQICTICTHQKADKINEAIVAGQSLRGIAEQYGTSATSLGRHKSHISGVLIKANKIKEIAKADTLLEQITDLKNKAMSILEKAEQGDDLRIALLAIKEARGCLEVLGKLAGELEGRDNNTIINIIMP